MTRAFSKQYLKTSNKLEILPPEGPAESVTGRVYLADRTGSGWQDCLKAGRTALLRLQSVLQDRHASCGSHTRPTTAAANAVTVTVSLTVSQPLSLFTLWHGLAGQTA